MTRPPTTGPHECKACGALLYSEHEASCRKVGELVSEMALFGDYAPTVEPESVSKWTEAMMLDLLRARYLIAGGNGPRYAYAEHVKSAVGFNAPRCADAIAMSLWGSDNTALHGHEVKVSRADWLTELKHPEKAEAFRPYMNHWWLVAPDKNIVRDDLPDGWGLMVPASDGRLRIAKRSPYREAEPMPKGMLAALLRATSKTARRAMVNDGIAHRYVRDTLLAQRADHGEPDWDDRAARVIDTLREAARW